MEVIVVDDGSTDDSQELVLALQRRYRDAPPLKLISQQNQGPGAARNVGVREACGTHVAFLDADDEWMPGFLKKIEQQFKRYATSGAKAACVGYIESPAGMDMMHLWRKRGIEQGVFELSSQSSLSVALARIAYLSSWSTVANRDTVLALEGFFDKERALYGEDTFLWLKLLLNHPVIFSLEPYVIYHRESSELTRNLKGPRPVEPFLRYPELIISRTPSDKYELALRVLRARALKTAMVLMLFGKIRQAFNILETVGPINGFEFPRLLGALYRASFPHDFRERIRDLIVRMTSFRGGTSEAA